MLEINQSKKIYAKASQLHSLGDYYDSLELLTSAIDVFNT